MVEFSSPIDAINDSLQYALYPRNISVSLLHPIRQRVRLEPVLVYNDMLPRPVWEPHSDRICHGFSGAGAQYDVNVEVVDRNLAACCGAGSACDASRHRVTSLVMRDLSGHLSAVQLLSEGQGALRYYGGNVSAYRHRINFSDPRLSVFKDFAGLIVFEVEVSGCVGPMTSTFAAGAFSFAPVSTIYQKDGFCTDVSGGFVPGVGAPGIGGGVPGIGPTPIVSGFSGVSMFHAGVSGPCEYYRNYPISPIVEDRHLNPAFCLLSRGKTYVLRGRLMFNGVPAPAGTEVSVLFTLISDKESVSAPSLEFLLGPEAPDPGTILDAAPAFRMMHVIVNVNKAGDFEVPFNTGIMGDEPDDVPFLQSSCPEYDPTTWTYLQVSIVPNTIWATEDHEKRLEYPLMVVWHPNAWDFECPVGRILSLQDLPT